MTQILSFASNIRLEILLLSTWFSAYRKGLSAGMAEAFRVEQIKFVEQISYDLKFNEKLIGKSFLDFEIESKIVVELKIDERFSKTNIDQVLNYIKVNGLKLAILLNFTKEGVKQKTIINVTETVHNNHS
jgi:GxxExxY protein